MNDFRRIVVPVDYSEPSDAALRLAAQLARAFDGRLLVFHFLPIEVYALADYPIVADPILRVDEETERLRVHVRKVLGDDAPPVAVEVSWGSPYVQIADYAVEHKADLIVMGTHGRTGVKHLLLGSVAERTVRLAPCPVLTVRGDAAVTLGAAATSGERPATRVAAMMERAAVTVASTDTLKRAHALMVEAGVRHLPVVDGTRLVGMLSDRDLGAHVGHFAHTRVNAAMTADPATAAPDTTVEDAARVMLARKVRALPVVERQRVVGVLSSTDILEDYVRIARE
jgi:nucleotide-binding universal stress UspA family protein